MNSRQQTSSGFDAGGSETLAALAQLPQREREALVLKHMVGLSVAEIAAELKVPEGTVKSWLSRGRTRLGAALAEEERDEAR